MNTLKFSQNWNNKLDCKKYFSTIRLYNNYRKVGDKLEIELQNKVIGTAEIKQIHNCYINELTDYVCFLDTGYNKTETTKILQKMYNVDWNIQKISILLLEWIKKD